MSRKEQSPNHSYLPWREEEYPLELSGKATLSITYFGEEKIPRGLSLKFVSLEVSLPIQKRQNHKQERKGTKTN